MLTSSLLNAYTSWAGIYLLERIQHLLHCMLSGSVGIGILSSFLFSFPSHLPFALSGDWIG